MAILKSCCFLSIRRGSHLAAGYTLVFYLMIFTAGTFHLYTVHDHAVLLIFTITMIVLSALTVLTSILLFIGLQADNAQLLIPWLATTVLTTIMDVMVTIFLLTEANFGDIFFLAMVVVDFAICVANVYCLLCVWAQFQEYRRSGARGRTVQDALVNSPQRETSDCLPSTAKSSKVGFGVREQNFAIGPTGESNSSKNDSLSPFGPQNSTCGNSSHVNSMDTLQTEVTLEYNSNQQRKVSADCTSARTETSIV